MKDERSKNAIAVAIKYGNNEATSEELSAAYAAAYAAAAFAAAAARTKNQLETADICRQYLPIEMWEFNH